MFAPTRLARSLVFLGGVLGFPTAALSQVVHVVYVVPADRTFRDDYRAGLEMAARDMQAFYQVQLQGGRTYRLDPGGVMVLYSTRDSSWYSSNVGPGGSNFNTFYANVRSDVEAILGRAPGSLHSGPDVWAINVDAHHACGQCGGCGANRVVVDGRNDLRGLVGESFQPVCPTDRDSNTRCRFIGGMGHELGHAFGLPHPPGCDAGLSTCDWGALMWAGYASYPNTYLRPEERAALLATPYVTALQPLSPVAVCGPVPPLPPGLFTAEVSGTSVQLNWNVPQEGGAPTSYTLRAGSAPGLSNVATLNIPGPTTTFQGFAPPGVYYVRLTAHNRYGSSSPAHEIQVTVGPVGAPPDAPTAFAANLQGLVATLSWTPPASAISGYVLEAGTSPGAANLAVVNLGPQTTFVTPVLSPGSYYVRVRAVNAAGIGAASNEVLLTVPEAPGAPTNLNVAVAGSVATLTWAAPPGTVTGYVLEGGSAPGATDLASLLLGPQLTFVSPPLPPGDYYVRVRARNSAGTGPPSNQLHINISPP